GARGRWQPHVEEQFELPIGLASKHRQEASDVTLGVTDIRSLQHLVAPKLDDQIVRGDELNWSHLHLDARPCREELGETLCGCVSADPDGFVRTYVTRMLVVQLCEPLGFARSDGVSEGVEHGRCLMTDCV